MGSGTPPKKNYMVTTNPLHMEHDAFRDLERSVAKVAMALARGTKSTAYLTS